MKIADVIELIEKKKLTCSAVTELFASQPYSLTADTITKSDGSGETTLAPKPHAHVHVRDGFVPLPPPPTSDSARIAARAALEIGTKQTQWANDSQLFANPTGMTLYDTPTELTSSSGLGMDRRMTDPNQIYNRRTGTPYMPATGKWKVKVPRKGGAPELMLAPDQGHPYALAPWKGTIADERYELLAKQKGTPGQPRRQGSSDLHGPDEISGKYVAYEPELPARDPSNPHSMFEDSESAIMTLTAALASTAGQKVLEAIRAEPRDVSLAIFSHTSVRALTAAVATASGWNTGSAHPNRNKAVQMVERVNTFNDKRELTGKFVITAVDMKHTVTLLSQWPVGELMLVSHYPVKSAIDGIGADDDQWEKKPSVFVTVKGDTPPPALVW